MSLHNFQCTETWCLLHNFFFLGLIQIFTSIPGNFLLLYSHILFLRVFTALDLPGFVSLSVICSCVVVYGSLDTWNWYTNRGIYCEPLGCCNLAGEVSILVGWGATLLGDRCPLFLTFCFLRMKPPCCLKTLCTSYPLMLHHIPEDQRHQGYIFIS